MAKKYYCPDCKVTFSSSVEPRFCLHCGSAKVQRDMQAARAKADALLKSVQHLTSEIEQVWEMLIPLLAERADKMNSLRQYKTRGVITQEEIPTIERMNLGEAMKAYRARKQEGSQGEDK